MSIRSLLVLAVLLISGCGCGMAQPAALDTALKAMPTPEASAK